MKKMLVCLLSWSLFGCGGGGEEPTDTTILASPPEGQGVQYSLRTTLAPGTEVEHCKFVRAPAEGLLINRDEVGFTHGNHHFLIYETNYTDPPAADLQGNAADTSDVFDCSTGTFQWDIARVIGGSQTVVSSADAKGGATLVELPDNAAIIIEPNTLLMISAHYINTTSEVIEPEGRVNLWTIPESQMEHEGDVLFLYDIFISVPEMSARTAKLRCPVYDDITITNLQGHMHGRGVGFAAGLMGQAPVYESTQWEDVTLHRFEGGGLQVPAGSTLEWACDYNNPAARHVYQGLTSEDEMCMLIGSYYPASPGTAVCSNDPAAPHQTRWTGAEWVGDGTATCAETLACLTGAKDNEGQACVADASPDVSKELSDMLRCGFTFGFTSAECAAALATCQAS